MLINAIEGVVENGRIRLRENVSLPENAKVYVIFTDLQEGPLAKIQTPHLAHPKQFRDFRKQVLEFPASFSDVGFVRRVAGPGWVQSKRSRA